MGISWIPPTRSSRSLAQWESVFCLPLVIKVLLVALARRRMASTTQTSQLLRHTSQLLVELTWQPRVSSVLRGHGALAVAASATTSLCPNTRLLLLQIS